ncbi:MAG: phosphate acetyltransferase [Acidobacteriota bacterium]|nr:phosphate acetyltransferase [Acidobacteriota bacterium]
MRETILARARQQPCRVVLPEGDDDRVVTAAYRIKDMGLGLPVPIAMPAAFEQVRKKLGFAEPDFPVHDPLADMMHYAEMLVERRKHKGLTLGIARDLCRDPLFRGALMLHADEADTCVGGAVRTTGDTVRAAIQVIGSGGKTVSSFFLMFREDHIMLYADCGVIPFPTREQLADIALASAKSWTQLTGDDPHVALLSFSTHGSAGHESIDLLHDALELVRQQDSDLNICGDLQADAALIPAIAESKAPESSVAGKANVLIFPNLHAGNIAYKLTQRLAGYTALGPVLQGLSKPMNDLSRGCSEDDILLVAAISAIQARS